MFGGSGTTALMSMQLGRKYVYIDNCEEYLKLAQNRVGRQLSVMDEAH